MKIPCGSDFIKILRCILKNNYYLYANSDTQKYLLEESQKVFLIGGDFGFKNFGDVAQLKSTISFYQRYTNLHGMV